MGVHFYILNKDEFLEDQRPINKFMPLERALNLLNSNSIWFAEPTEWPDPFEKMFLISQCDGKNFPWKDRVFCSCFTDNAASEASWNAYSRGQICIRMSFNRKALISLLENYSLLNPQHDVFFDKVQYLQTKSIIKPLLKIPFDPPLKCGKDIRSNEFKSRLLLLKRKSFEYEKEYRALIVRPKASTVKGIRITFDNPNELIESIAVGPNLGKDTIKLLKDTFVDKYKFSNKSIQQSYLYTEISKHRTIRKE